MIDKLLHVFAGVALGFLGKWQTIGFVVGLIIIFLWEIQQGAFGTGTAEALDAIYGMIGFIPSWLAVFYFVHIRGNSDR